MLTRKFKLFTLLFLFHSFIGYSQYECGCGFVTINSISSSPSGPGCSITANVSITATSTSCVNNSWTWNTTPAGSSGSIYVGFSNNAAVPYTQTTSLNFYLPVDCSILGSNFLNFFLPQGGCAISAMPVYFKNIYQDKSNLIWNVESELNCSHYDVEGSNDAISWEKIGQNECNNVSAESEYTFEVLRNFQYVRVVQNDFDGNITISNVTKWENETLPFNATHNGRMITQGENIILPQQMGNKLGKISVTDIFGSNHYNGTIQSLDTSKLPSGQYLINIHLEESAEITKVRLVIL